MVKAKQTGLKISIEELPQL